MASSMQCSWVDFQVPEHAPGVPGDPTDPCFGKNPCSCSKGCGGGCGCAACQTPAKPGARPFSGNPVRYGTGEIYLVATDLQSEGFGVPWGHTRNFANRLTEATNLANGYNWQIFEWSYLVFPTETTVVVMGNANAALWFDLVGTSYVPRFSVRQTLLLNADANTYQLIDLDGSITQYNASSGVFQSHTDPAGNQVAVVSYTANAFNFTEVQRTTTAGGSTTVESFLYTYVDATQPYPVLSSVLLRRQVNGGAWTNVTQALYSYYGCDEPYGATNDLKTVSTQTWEQSAWVSTGTTYYRYYLSLPSSSSSSSSVGDAPGDMSPEFLFPETAESRTRPALLPPSGGSSSSSFSSAQSRLFVGQVQFVVSIPKLLVFLGPVELVVGIPKLLVVFGAVQFVVGVPEFIIFLGAVQFVVSVPEFLIFLCAVQFLVFLGALELILFQCLPNSGRALTQICNLAIVFQFVVGRAPGSLYGHRQPGCPLCRLLFRL